MIYTKTLGLLRELLESLQFQERRNFFNNTKDLHLNYSINIVEAILNKESICELSYDDLAAIIQITTKMISIVNISDESQEIINNLTDCSIELIKENLKITQ